MISAKNILFSSRHTDADVTLHINNVIRYPKKYMNNHIYILDIDMYIQTEDMKNQAYIDNDIRSPLKMLFIGEELTESTLFDLLSQSEISLHEVKVKYKFDYICQMSEDGYRYINNKLETVASLSLLRAIKDFGVNYNSRKFAILPYMKFGGNNRHFLFYTLPVKQTTHFITCQITQHASGGFDLFKK